LAQVLKLFSDLLTALNYSNMISLHVLLLSCAWYASALRRPLTPPIEMDRNMNSSSTNVHLLSFRSCSQDESAPCNKHFFEELLHLSNIASKIRAINHHHLFQGLPKEILEDPKWAKHVVEKPFVRGRGYWFWKPALFNHLIRNKKVSDGDILIWADPDNTRYFDSPEIWPAQLELLANSNLDLFVKSQDYCERQWTKEDIYRKFNTTSDDVQYGKTRQVHAQFWIVTVNERTRKFMKMWEDLMTDFHLCSDEPSIAPNNHQFRENRHDQSILSMLTKAQAPSGLKDVPGEKSSESLCAPVHYPEYWQRNPTFGIPGLTAHVGNFLELLDDVKNGELQHLSLNGQHSHLDVSKLSTSHSIRRNYCMAGVCYDLDTALEQMSDTGAGLFHLP